MTTSALDPQTRQQDIILLVSWRKKFITRRDLSGWRPLIHVPL